jgi:hypothetical protein
MKGDSNYKSITGTPSEKKNYSKLIEHLLDLRAATLHQPGYISGETLVKGDDPKYVMIVYTWIS